MLDGLRYLQESPTRRAPSKVDIVLKTIIHRQDGRASSFLTWEDFGLPAVYKIHFATSNYFRLKLVVFNGGVGNCIIYA